MKWFPILFLLPCGLAFASQDGFLRSVREVNEFLERGNGRTNYLLAVQVYSDPTDVAMLVRDETGRTVISNQRPVDGLRKGDLLEIRGYASVNPNGETWTHPMEVAVCGNEPVPAPTDIGLSELNRPENAYLPVRVSGTVFSVTPDEFDDDCIVVMLCDGDATAHFRSWTPGFISVLSLAHSPRLSASL